MIKKCLQIRMYEAASIKAEYQEKVQKFQKRPKKKKDSHQLNEIWKIGGNLRQFNKFWPSLLNFEDTCSR